MPDWIEVASQHIEVRYEKELVSWLIRGFATSDFTPVSLEEEPSAVVQLKRLFERLVAPLQEKLKAAAVRSLVEWSLEAHGPAVLRELLYLVAYTRATEAIDPIRIILDTRVLEELNPEACLRTVQVLIGVLAGFVPLDAAGMCLERLFFSDRFHHRFAAQELVALCEWQPEKHMVYVQEFLEIVAANPTYYRLDWVLAELSRIVGLRRIGRGVERLESPYREQFLELLHSQTQSPVRVLMSEPDGLMLVTNPRLGMELEIAPLDCGDSAFERECIMLCLKLKMREIEREEGAVAFIERCLGIASATSESESL